MIVDSETNHLYLADSLQVRYPAFFNSFLKVIGEMGVPMDIIPGTADIWARDYMPLQVSANKFVQFTYDPDYLKKYQSLVSNVDRIVDTMRLAVEKSSIKLDGGNVVRSKDKVILCDKVFLENPELSRNVLIRQLEELFEVSQLIFISTAKNDIIGHADGYVRFLDEKTVLVNDYGEEDQEYKEKLFKSLGRQD